MGKSSGQSGVIGVPITVMSQVPPGYRLEPHHELQHGTALHIWLERVSQFRPDHHQRSLTKKHVSSEGSVIGTA
jgi:hypothetical protein